MYNMYNTCRTSRAKEKVTSLRKIKSRGSYKQTPYYLGQHLAPLRQETSNHMKIFII